MFQMDVWVYITHRVITVLPIMFIILVYYSVTLLYIFPPGSVPQYGID